MNNNSFTVCDIPSLLNHSTSFVTGPVFGNNLVPNVELSYVCDENYQISGPSTIKCDAEGNWTDQGVCYPDETVDF